VPLTRGEVEFLLTVRDRQGTGDPAVPYLPLHPAVRGLVDRGYLRLTNLRAGPLLLKIEDKGLAVTEAGEVALAAAVADQAAK
jgi:hypothetical protein